MPHVDVNWVALECRRRQEKSDELYGTVSSISSPSGQSTSLRMRELFGELEMGKTGSRIASFAHQVYSGPPEALDVTVTLVERDSGDEETINGYEKRVADAVAQAAGQVAGAFTSGASAAAQPIIDGLARALVDEASDVLGAGDDPYLPGHLHLEPGQLADPNRPRQVLQRQDDPRTAEFTDFTTVSGRDDRGDVGEYRFYFDVRVTGVPDTTLASPVPVRTVKLAAAHSGKVLDVLNGSTDDRAPLVQFDSHDGHNQRFRLDDVGDGLFRIVALHSGKVLDVTGFSMDNETPIIQFEWHGGNNQKWRLEDVGDGRSKIVSAHSGKVLDVHGASLENLAPVTQFDFVGGLNQMWRELLVVVAPFHPGEFHPTHD